MPAPVGHRALGDHHQQAQDREQEDAARGQREARRGLALGLGALSDPRRAHEDRHEQQHGGDRDGDARVDAERGEPGREARADHAAERPARVQRGHDRPAEVALDLDAVGVHRDVHRRVRRAEHEQRDRHEQRARGEHDEVDGHHVGEAAEPGHAHRAPLHDRLPGDREGDDHRQRHADEHEPHRALGEVEALLDPRDLRDEGADHGAVDEEQARRRPAPAHARVTVTPSAR